MINQWLDGVPCEDISVEIVFIDGGSGEQVFFGSINYNNPKLDLPNFTFGNLPAGSPETKY